VYHCKLPFSWAWSLGKASYYQPQSNRCGVNCDQKGMSKNNLMILPIMSIWFRYSRYLFAYFHFICLLYFAFPWFLLPIQTKAKNQKSKSYIFRKSQTCSSQNSNNILSKNEKYKNWRSLTLIQMKQKQTKPMISISKLIKKKDSIRLQIKHIKHNLLIECLCGWTNKFSPSIDDISRWVVHRNSIHLMPKGEDVGLTINNGEIWDQNITSQINSS